MGLTIYFNNLTNLIVNWWPWVYLFNDLFLIEFFIIYSIICICIYSNIYYSYVYTFFSFFLIGIYLAVVQVEFFTAFLWLIECSVLFIFLLLLFYVNVKGLHKYTPVQFFKIVSGVVIVLFVFLSSIYFEFIINNIYVYNLYLINDNYYEAFTNNNMNDFSGFLISYFYINSFEFILIGFLLLIGSVICVNLYQINKSASTQNLNLFFQKFNFFTNFIVYYFLRKQSLIKQGNSKSFTKIFKKSN